MCCPVLLAATGLNSWLHRKRCRDPDFTSASKARARASAMLLLSLLLPFLDVAVQHYRTQGVTPKERGQDQDLAPCPA